MNQSNRLKTETTNSVVNFFYHWPSLFVLDYWWRKKYNVPFGSEVHRNANFFDMLIEYREDLMMKESLIKQTTEQPDDFGFMPLSKKEIDDDYENLDLDQFNNG